MLELKNISKTYRSKNGVTHRALNDVSLSFGETGLVFIVGRSGGGKSTLLNVIAALDKADRGEILLYGNSFKDFSSAKLDSYRNTYIGVVFQDYNLLPTLTVYQNIALSLGLQNVTNNERVDAVVDRLGLREIADRKPNEISGGQSQRVAIARAVIKDPRIILADEPTGNLDSKTGREMFDVFKEISKEKLVIIVTHDRDIADEIGDRVIEIKDGRIHKDLIKTTELYEPAIDTVGDSLVRVPKGKHLDELALEEINSILSKTDRDTYIINESDTAKVKSMNIHVKNAVELNQADNSTYYFPYRPEPEENKPISLIKSKMPLSVGFKLSLSMLKYKKFRLVITIIMLLLALFLSAVVGVFKFYNTDRALAKTITAEKFTYLNIKKAGDYDAETVFTDDDRTILSSSSKCVQNVYFGKAEPAFISDNGEYVNQAKYNDYSSLFKSFYGVVEMTDGLPGFEYTAGGEPAGYGDAVISKLVATFIIDKSIYKGADSFEKLIGKEFELSGNRLKICGIYETDVKEYEKAKDVLTENGMNLSLENIAASNETLYYPQLTERDGFVFVKSGFIDNILGNTTKAPVSVVSVNSGKNVPAAYVSPDTTAENYIYKNDSVDGVVIDFALYSQIFSDHTNEKSAIEKNLNAFNRENSDYLIRQTTGLTSEGSQTSLIKNSLKIRGVVEGTDGTMFIDNDSFQKFISDAVKVKNVLVYTSGSVGGNIKLIRDIKKIGAYPNTRFYSDYIQYEQNLGMLSTIFSRMLIMISVAAALLLFSFVSSSVKLESRQIGILRGMGARGIDTFKAFGIEGATITTFSLVLTLILIAVLFPLINMGMSNSYAYHFYSIVINPFAIILIIITAMLITAAAIIIPLIRLTKMTPVKAMTNNQTQR